MNWLNTIARHHSSRKTRRTAPRTPAIAESLENRQLLSTVSGTVASDTNGDYIYTPGFDQPLAGWTVFLDNNMNGIADGGETTATTDLAGAYQFTGLAAGTYAVRLELQPGLHSLTPQGAYIVVNLQSATETSADNNFSVTPNPTGGSTISGTVYRDVDLNGTLDLGTDQFLAGWTVFLDANGNGAIDNAELTATTDQYGVYQFTGLPLASYISRIVLPVGWRMSEAKFGFQMIGPVDGINDAVGFNFGVTTTIQITGSVYDDADGSGTRSIAEIGVPNWTVYLDANNNAQFDLAETSVLSDTQGEYVFDNLPTNNYTVRLVPQAGMRTTGPNSQTWSANIPAGSYWRNTDFGVTGTNSISGKVFIDANASGGFDGGDVYLPYWTVYLDTNNDSVIDAGEPTALTGPDGAFVFPAIGNLPVFHLRVDAPLGWSITQPVTQQSYDLLMLPGQTIGTEVFGLRPASTSVGFSGKVYQDNNRDGVQQFGEPDLAGWVVYVDTNQNNVYDQGEPLTWTDISGNYELPPQTPGSIHVSVVLPTPDWYTTNPAAGFIAVIPHSSGDVVVAGSNFGLSRASVGRISGVVFQDTNLDGIQDPGEVAIAGARVYMNNIGPGNSYVTTDSTGAYAFNSLVAGTYTVLVDRSIIADGTMWPSTRLGGVYTITLANNRGTATANFGLTPHFAVTGSVVFDSNGNAVTEEGEQFLADWIVLGDLNQNGAQDAGEPTALTDSAGYYYLVFPAVSLTAPTPILVGINGHTDSWGNPTAWVPTGVGQIMIQPSAVLNDYRFTVQPVDPAYLLGRVFNDANRSGFYDAGDSPIADVKVFFDLNDDGQFQIQEPFAYSDASGQYMFRWDNVASQFIPASPLFEGVQTGKYHLRVAYDPTIWQPANPVAAERITTINPGLPEDPTAGVNFGLEPVAGISGTVFVDANASGSHDPNERGQAGVTVYVDANNNGLLDSGEQTAITGADGKYAIYQVPPGQKVVRENVPGGYRQTRPGNAYFAVNVASGKVVTCPEFGNSATGMIRGSVFNDANRNGIQDPNEPGLPNSDVYLDSNQNGVLDFGELTKKTNNSGNYVFNGLTPAVYRVSHIWVSEYQPASGVPFSDVVVGYGQSSDAPLAGNLPHPRITGYAFDDRNRNGRRDPKEAALVGAVVYLDTNRNGQLDGEEQFVQLGSSGKFSFILPGAGKHVLRILPVNKSMSYIKPAGKKYTLFLGTGELFSKAIFGLTRIKR